VDNRPAGTTVAPRAGNGRGVGQVPDLLGDADPPLGLVVIELVVSSSSRMKSRASAVLPTRIGTTRQNWCMACGPSFADDVPYEGETERAACTAMAVRVSCRHWRTAESAGVGSGRGRSDPPLTRPVIFSGKRRRPVRRRGQRRAGCRTIGHCAGCRGTGRRAVAGTAASPCW